MKYQTLRIHLTPATTVRLLLTAVLWFVLALIVLLSSQQAIAQSAVQEPYGYSRDEIVAQLDESYKEAPVAGGIATNGNILEVFASPDGLSWTIIVTRPNGLSSVIAKGEGWSFIAAVEGLRI